jgi:HSP20 family molecular chaperone IbpA
MSQVALKNPDQVAVKAELQTERIYRPLVNISEFDEAIVLVAEMPGVSVEGLNISVEKRQLLIEGVIERATPAGFESIYNELPYGKYQRTFQLADMIDAAAITASLDNGLLTLTLPVAPKEKPRKIEITTV